MVRRGRAQRCTPRRGVAALVLALGLFIACGDGGEHVVGVVTAIDGGLLSVNSFTVRTPDGENLTFVASPDATFHGGPLSHITDHLRSGAPVTVSYREEAGQLVATEVDDG